MLPAAKTETDSHFFELYDKYSPSLYGLLLGLMSTKAQAEAVLTEVFEKVHRDKLYSTNAHCIGTSLFRLAVITAYKRQFDTNGFLEKVNALPRLHRLLLGNISLQTFDTEHSPNSGEYGRDIAAELKQFMQGETTQSLQVQN